MDMYYRRKFGYRDEYYDRDAGKSQAQRQAEFQPIDDLLLKQRKGTLMTREEKDRVTKYANAQRKKNLQNKKKR